MLTVVPRPALVLLSIRLHDRAMPGYYMRELRDLGQLQQVLLQLGRAACQHPACEARNAQHAGRSHQCFSRGSCGKTVHSVKHLGIARILEPAAHKGKPPMKSHAEIPSFLYGTAWKEERSEALTTLALQAGFTAIDSANQRKHYFEAAVGKAVQSALSAGSIERGRMFLQSKFTFQAGQDQRLPYDPKSPIAVQVQQSFHSSLEHFGTDYLDSYLLHGPSTRGRLARDDVQAWQAIEQLAQAGQVRFIGVSNFTLAQLQQLLGLAQVAPRFLQNRCYASTGWDREVRALCAEHGIVYQGFSLLTANRSELSAPRVQELASRLRLTTAQLVFAFARHVGVLPLTGTSNPEHMRLDLAALDVALQRADVELIEHVCG